MVAGTKISTCSGGKSNLSYLIKRLLISTIMHALPRGDVLNIISMKLTA